MFNYYQHSRIFFNEFSYDNIYSDLSSSKTQCNHFHVQEFFPSLIKSVQRDFTITTNNSTHQFNRYILFATCHFADQNNQQNLDEFHISIDDDQGIMNKIELLYMGEPVEFLKADSKILKRIVTELQIDGFPKYVYLSNEFNSIYTFSYRLAVFPDKVTLQMNLKHVLQNLPSPLKIRTKKQTYSCNRIISRLSNVLKTLLDEDPNLEEFILDFEDISSEFEPLSQILNGEWESISVNQIDTIRPLAEQLEIIPLIEFIDNFSHELEEQIEKVDSKSEILHPYIELFDLLCDIQHGNIPRTLDYILRSSWIRSKSEVQELVACLIQISGADLRNHPHLTDLIILLDERKSQNEPLSILIPFLTQRLLIDFANTTHNLSFLYHLYRKNAISIELILQKIIFMSKSKQGSIINSQPLLLALSWFYPELLSYHPEMTRIFSKLKEEIDAYLKSPLNKPEVAARFILLRRIYDCPIEDMNYMRDNCTSNDEITEVLRNDDVETLRSILSRSHIDYISRTIFDNHVDKVSTFLPIFKKTLNTFDISLINYAALYGSINCFKYLLLLNSSLDILSLAYAVYGNNLEILRIIIEHQKEILESPQNLKYQQEHFLLSTRKLSSNSLIFYALIISIHMHRNQISDWLIQQPDYDVHIDLPNLLLASIESANAHTLISLFDHGLNLNRMHNDFDFNTPILAASRHGYLKILQFLFSFKDSQMVVKSEINNTSRNEQSSTNPGTVLFHAASFGSLSIFRFFLSRIEDCLSFYYGTALDSAVSNNYLEIVTFILEDCNYSISPLHKNCFLNKAISRMATDVINYLLEDKDILITFETIQYALFHPAADVLQKLIQKIDDNQSMSELHPQLIDIQDEMLVHALQYSSELVELLLEKGFWSDKLLIKAVSTSELPVVSTILKYNHSSQFVNYIGPQGTALNVAVSLEKNNIVEALLKLDEIDPLRSSRMAKTPFMTACSIGNLNALDLIISFYKNRATTLLQHVNFFFRYLLQPKKAIPKEVKEEDKTNEEEAFQTHLINASVLNPDYNGHRAKLAVQLERMTNHFEHHSTPVKQKRCSPELTQEVLLKLLEIENVDPNCQNNNETLLSFCIFKKYEKVVKKLLEFPNLNISNYISGNGDTYLHLAIASSRPILNLLLKHNEFDINLPNLQGDTPLLLAIKERNEELVRIIINHPRFDPIVSKLNDSFFLSISPPRKSNTTEETIKDDSNPQEIMNMMIKRENERALTQTSKAISRLLLKTGKCDVNYQHINEQNFNQIDTPLMEAVRANDEELIDLIILDPLFDPEKSCAVTSLFRSAVSGNVKMFRTLLRLTGDNINIKNQKDYSLLTAASLVESNSEILNEILNHKDFDPVESAILVAFVYAANDKVRDLLFEYDLLHGKHINLRTIRRIMKILPDISTKPFAFLRVKLGLVPDIQQFCTYFIVSSNSYPHQDLFRCKTCKTDTLFCAVCARFCHQGHHVYLFNKTNKASHRFDTTIDINFCQCGAENPCCKCKVQPKGNNESDKPAEIQCPKEINNSAYAFLENIGQKKIAFKTKALTRSSDFDSMLSSRNALNTRNRRNPIHHNDEFVNNLQCLFDLCRSIDISYPMYQCYDCGNLEGAVICQHCALRCHANHKLKFAGLKKAHCQCFNHYECICTKRKTRLCTFLLYGNQNIIQTLSQCSDCGLVGKLGACPACTHICHANHHIEKNKSENSVCNCGSRSKEMNCQCCTFPEFDYLKHCTNRDHKNRKIKSRLYHCLICNLATPHRGFCESCAIHCHYGHPIEYVGTTEFICECSGIYSPSGKKLMQCCSDLSPEMPDTRKCRRLRNDKDYIIGGAYVCYTCDQEGKKKFCESCAVRCHQGHDVHIIEYSAFECSCDLEHCQCMVNDEEDGN